MTVYRVWNKPICMGISKKNKDPYEPIRISFFMFQRLQQKRCSNCCFVPGAAAAWSKWRSFENTGFSWNFWGIFNNRFGSDLFMFFSYIWYTERLFYYFLAILETKKELFDYFQLFMFFLGTSPSLYAVFHGSSLTHPNPSWPSDWTQNWQVTFLNMPERPGIFLCTQVWRSHEASSSSKFFRKKMVYTFFKI